MKLLSQQISRPVYLHYFDRELLSCMGAYNTLSDEQILFDTKLILLSTYEYTYFSTALVFENRYARMISNKLPLMFQRGHIRLAMRESSIHDYIVSKQEQYRHARERYRFYFDGSWKFIEELGPIYLHKYLDTSTVLEKNIVSNISKGAVYATTERLLIDTNNAEIAKLLPYAAESIVERNGRAITRLLFDSSFNKYNPMANTRRFFETVISEHYVDSYITEFNGTIASGLSSGIEYFSFFCPTYPFHHIPVWHQLYNRLGCIPIIRMMCQDELSDVRESIEFQAFIDATRKFIARSVDFHSTGNYTYHVFDNQHLLSLIERDIRVHIDVAHFSRIKKADSLITMLGEMANCIESSEVSGDSTQDTVTRIICRGGIPVKDTVFVVYGRNEKARKALFDFLRAAGLKPLEWEQAVALTGKAAPYVGEVIDAGLAKAQAVLILFTGDDEAKLRDDLLKAGEMPEHLTPQPRPNVILEAGIALGRYPDRTLIIQLGHIRDISDLTGRHVIRLDNSIESRKKILTRLQTAQCAVDIAGNDWMTAGDFTV